MDVGHLKDCQKDVAMPIASLRVCITYKVLRDALARIRLSHSGRASRWTILGVLVYLITRLMISRYARCSTFSVLKKPRWFDFEKVKGWRGAIHDMTCDGDVRSQCPCAAPNFSRRGCERADSQSELWSWARKSGSRVPVLHGERTRSLSKFW